MAVSTIPMSGAANWMSPQTLEERLFFFFGNTDSESGTTVMYLRIPWAAFKNGGTLTISNLKISIFGPDGIVGSSQQDMTSYISSTTNVNKRSNVVSIVLSGNFSSLSNWPGIGRPITGNVYITGTYTA